MVTTLFIAVCVSIGSIFPISHIPVFSNMNDEILVQADDFNSVPGQSTDYLMPGSSSLNYSHLVPAERSYIVFEENDSERVFVGTLTERLVATSKENRPFLLRIHELQTDDVQRESMVMADIQAAEIVFDATSANQYSATHYYTAENEIIGDFNFSDKQTESVRAEVQFPVFSSEAIDVIIRSIPLFSGYEAHFVGYDHRKSDLFTPVTLTVEKLETITAHEGKTHRTWKVNATTKDSETTYYVDKYSREIIRIELRGASDKLLVMEQF